MSSSTSTCVNNTFHFKTVDAAAAPAMTPQSPPPLPRVSNPQKGIVSILGSDCGGGAGAAPSIRRTLSADMSSKNWLSQNGFIKKIASSSEGEEEEDELIKRPGQDEVWKSIQEQKLMGINVNGDDDDQKPIRSAVSWSAILLSNQKADQDSPPYIHPLVKKSSGSLSKQSLEICTESLGSETGSDCLSAETGDSDHIQNNDDIFNDLQDVKINYSKKSPPPSFPPPLPSLANSCVQLRSHRQGGGGRLILEAVSVPQRNYFHAERSDGRLLLTALKSPGSQEAGDDETEGFGKVFDEIEEVDSSSDDGYEEEEDEEEELPAATAAASFNTNHYYSINTPNIAEYKQQEGLIPLLRGCKEARRSLLTWESNFCIATS